MPQIVNKKSVLDMAMGAIAEITDYEVERVVANIMDPNTAAKAFLSTLSLRRATAKVHKTVGHFCAYETNFMEIASSC